MKSEDLKHVVVTVIAIVALILALFSVLMEEAGETTEDESIPPLANINVTSTSVEVGSYIGFDGSGSLDSDGKVVEYIWDFGDGIKDTGIYESHFYSTAGTYNVTLTVIDNEGESDVDSIEITVTQHQNESPNATISVNTVSVEIGQYVCFNASESTDPDGTIIGYIWDFGDGIKDTGIYESHFYSTAGTYNVTLTVIDNEGESDVDSIEITVTPHQNESPNAAISVNTMSVEIGQYVCFNASESTDPDGTIIEYTWDFGDGNKDSGMYSIYFYSSAGTYSVTLTVIDDEGASDIDLVSITVIEGEGPPQNDPPNAVIYVENTTAQEGSSIVFNGSESSDSDGTIVEYIWDFSDGTKDSGMHSSHKYQTYGTYNVTLTVIDDDGAIDVSNITITVIQNTPTISMNWHEDSENPGNWTGNVVSISGISTLYTDDVTVIVTQNSQSGSKDLNELASSPLTVGTLTLSFSDQTPIGILGAADTFTIVGAQAGDTIRLMFKPTGEQMCCSTIS